MLNKTVVIGVTGGIAAYKTAEIVSTLAKKGVNVFVVMTKNATKFISPLTFETLSGNPVAVEMFRSDTPFEIEHISLAKRADLVCIAPATANVIGKLAMGIADDLLTTTVMATKAPVLIAPAMNVNMYNHSVVQENIQKLKSYGYEFVEPEEGWLACGDEGVGRLANVNTIIDEILKRLLPPQDLAGRRVVVTAGPTREMIDPVRYISNRSSGKMGYAVAQAAQLRGAKVTLITGPTALRAPQGIEVVEVETTQEMYHAVMNGFAECDIVIKAAAPADYCVEKPAAEKIKKKAQQGTVQLRLIETPDISAELGRKKKHQILVVFAAETQNGIENALLKLEAKNADVVVYNDITTPGAGFEGDTNIATLMGRDGSKRECKLMSKQELAHIILDEVSRLLK